MDFKPSPAEISEQLKDEAAITQSGAFSDFEILEQVAQTGMGIVYKANQKQLQRDCALKVLTPQKEFDAISIKRFINEAKVICLLDHPHIVKVFSFGFKDEQSPFISMEWLEGKSLDKILASRRLKISEFKCIFLQILDALEHAHNKGIIHRDLKPSNIFILQAESDTQGKYDANAEIENCKLLDFGIAHVDGENAEGMKLTRTGVLLGTPAFMSPEQTRNEKLDRRTDIYSIGLVMYEALTGSPAFTGDTALDIMYKQSTAKVDQSKLPESSEFVELNQCILKCLEKNPENRFQTVSELLKAFETSCNHLDVAQDTPLTKAPKRGNAKLVVGSILALCLLSFTLFQWQEQARNKEAEIRKQAEFTVPDKLPYDRLFELAKKIHLRYQQERRKGRYLQSIASMKQTLQCLAKAESVSIKTQEDIWAKRMPDKIISESNHLRASVDAGNTAYNAAKIMGKIHLAERNPAEARACFERAAKYQYNNVVLFSIAKRYSAHCDYLEGKAEAALTKLKETLPRVPSNDETKIGNDVLWEHSNVCMDMGTILLKIGKQAEAASYIKQSMLSKNFQLEHSDRTFEAELALSATSNEKDTVLSHLENSKALSTSEQLEMRSDQCSRSLAQLAHCLESFDLSAAENTYVQAISLAKKGNQAATLADVAEQAFALTIERNDEQLFEQWLNKALTQVGINYNAPGTGKAALNDGAPMKFEESFARASFKFLKGEYKIALEEFEAASMLADTGRDCEMRAELMMGYCCSKLSDKESAESHFEKALVDANDIDRAKSRKLLFEALKEYERIIPEPITKRFKINLEKYEQTPRSIIEVRVSDS